MKRILVGGLVTALAAGGLGLTTGTSATASPLSGPGAQGASVCTILPVLCSPSTPGTNPVAQALESLAAAGPSATPAQLDTVVSQLGGTGLPTSTLESVVTEVVEQLQAGTTGWPAGVLDGDMLAATVGQVVAQLPAGATPTDVPGVVENLVGSVQRLVEAVLSALTGAGAPDTGVLSDLASALLTGDTGGVTDALSALTGTLDPAAVQALVADLVGAIGDLGGAGSDLDATELRALLGSFITSVTDLARDGGLPTDAVQALLTGLVDALTAPGAADPFGSLQVIARDLITVLRTFGTSTTTIIERLLPVSVPTPTPNPNPNPRPPAPRATLATPSLSTATYSTSKRPAFTGRGTAGATVTVRTTGGQALAVVRVASDGGWSARSATKLKRGAYRVVARQSATGKNTSRPSAARSFRVVSATPKLTSRKSTKANRPVLKGVGFPGARIVVRTKSGKVLARTRVKADGTFKVRSKRLANGTYKTRATQKRGSQVKRSAYRTVRVR